MTAADFRPPFEFTGDAAQPALLLDDPRNLQRAVAGDLLLKEPVPPEMVQ
jgi:hypothetical protein